MTTASDVALRVVADHVRTAVMLVADGVLPSNEGRGYVLRRILRRSIYNLRLLAGGQRGGGSDGRYLHELADTAISAMADQFPELRIEAPRILGVIDAEESTFLSTLRTGSAIFDAAVGETKRRGTTSLSGDQAFQLHDTYGFPIDLTLEMASEQGLTVDEEGFRRLMAEQRQRAKQDSLEKKTGNADISVFAGLLAKSGPVEFTGYDEISGRGHGGRAAGQRGERARGRRGHRGRGHPGPDPVLRRGRRPAGRHRGDPGGQRPGAAGGEVEVRDVQTPVPGLIVHRGVGHLRRGRRRRAGRGRDRHRPPPGHLPLAHRHAHGAPRDPRRAGRLRRPGRIGELARPAALRLHRRRAPCRCPCCATWRTRSTRSSSTTSTVRAFVTPIDEARAMGAIALFGEKYGDEVRVVEVGDYSRELCGGTHVAHSGQLGLIKILGESSIGSGVRRVEALVGTDAFRYLARESVLVSQLTEQLKTRREDLPDRVASLVSRLREAERDLDRLRSAQILGAAAELAAAGRGRRPGRVRRAPGPGRHHGGRHPQARPGYPGPARRSSGPRVVVVAGVPADRPAVVVAVNEAARALGVTAGALVRSAAGALGGGGGGRDDIAQGGGAPQGDRAGQAIAEAFDAVRAVVRDMT